MPETSAWNKFPTDEDPLSRYKFTSVEVNFSADQLIVDRSTYSLLDWLGDMGGLLDALYLLGAIFMSPISNFALNADLLSYLFRYRGSEEGLKERTYSMKKLIYM